VNGFSGVNKTQGKINNTANWGWKGKESEWMEDCTFLKDGM
jgi:hypothetical protein